MPIRSAEMSKFNNSKCWRYGDEVRMPQTGAVRSGCHQPHVVLEYLNCGECDRGTKFLNLFNFNSLKCKNEYLTHLSENLKVYLQQLVSVNLLFHLSVV